MYTYSSHSVTKPATAVKSTGHLTVAILTMALCATSISMKLVSDFYVNNVLHYMFTGEWYNKTNIIPTYCLDRFKFVFAKTRLGKCDCRYAFGVQLNVFR